MKEIPLRERIVAALKPREENQRSEGILLSDWTLAAVKQREEERRRKAQAERAPIALKPREENQRGEGILLSDWTLAAVKQREEERRRKAQAERAPIALKPREENQRGEGILLSDWTLAAVKQREEERRRNEREEKQRGKEIFVSDSIITFKRKEEERREKQKEEKHRAEEPPLIDSVLAAVKQKEEERRKKKQAAEAAVITMKQAEVAEARIVDEQAEADRRTKDEWRERDEAETVLRAVEDRRQRKRKETRAVPKSGIVRSRGTARTIRGILLTLATVAIAGAIGFGAGVYATPPDKADEFRALVNSKLDEIKGLMHHERAAIEPKAKGPTQAAAPTEPEVVPKEIQSAVPAQSETEAPATDATGQKDLLDNNAIRPSVSPTESSNSQSPLAPAPSAEPVVPFMSATPPKTENFEQAKPVAKKAPVTKPQPKAPVKKPKPKPKPAEHHPKVAPAEQTPAAEEPAQQ
ncbi:MAG: hypothetical protein ABSD90_02075 [Methylocystis sp.]